MSATRTTPVIAILTMPHEDKQFRGNRQNFIDIITAGRKLHIPVYIVTTNDLHLGRRQIIAYEYVDHEQKWKQRLIPFPDVIYNRIPFREDEQQPEVKQLIEDCLKDPNIRLFNPSFFNKWDLFEWISGSKRTRMHVPMTKKYTPSLKLLPLLRKYSFLYLKPERGKAGMGIMRIRRLRKPRLCYSLSTQESKTSQTIYFQTVSKLREHLNFLIGDQAYIIQRGILLSSVQGRPFDLRVLLQKNKQGTWSITGIGARQAGETSITTHVPRGGTIESPKKLLTTSFSSTQAGRVLKRTARTALRLAKQIEQSSGDQLGEMSMDLGVDRKARIWFFEANSKPMKFDESHIRQRSLVRFFDYCRYLDRTKKQHSGHHHALH